MLLDPDLRAKAKFLERFSLSLIEAQSSNIVKVKKRHILKRKTRGLDPVIKSLVP